ncbi:GXGXG motif-containing protein [Brevibacterium linens]|uniref:GltB/FmdC/FwdC-like GXGXG domain-containing protein n=1 Tax=Brevibacterium linens TaxID=1703 RepID=UPI003BF52081
MTTSSKTEVLINSGHRPLREVNREIRAASEAGHIVTVSETLSRHNLGVGLSGPGLVKLDGNVGYYCGGLNNGGQVLITGNSGWATGEGMAAGLITVDGSAGMSAGAAMRGGVLHIRGNAGPRCGIAQKSGDIVVEGDIGYLTGFMSHGGRIICLGNSIGSVGDSLWQGTVWVAGEIEKLGIDAEVITPSEEDVADVDSSLERLGIEPAVRNWKQIVAGKKLWYFEARDAKKWLMI